MGVGIEAGGGHKGWACVTMLYRRVCLRVCALVFMTHQDIFVTHLQSTDIFEALVIPAFQTPPLHARRAKPSENGRKYHSFLTLSVYVWHL